MSDSEPPNKSVHYAPLEAYTTTFNADMVAEMIGLPEDVRGLSILDIASGGSNSVASLRRAGASAFGIDVGYRNMKNFRAKVADFVNAYGDTVQTTNDLTKSYLKDNSKQKEIKTVFGQMEESIDKGVYVAGLAEELPFADNSFDIVYSMLGITVFPVHDLAAFTKSMNEGTRVLKPGGKFITWPWPHSSKVTYWENPDLDNMAAFLKTVPTLGVEGGIKLPQKNIGLARLVLTKPK